MSIWSIGIYQGPNPWSLTPHPLANNPVMTAAQITDCNATFVADPFMLRHEGIWHMFFETLPTDCIGVIGHATSPDALRWTYQATVLREPFHLSYPHVFRRGEDYFMTPETLGAKAIRLYRADPFPSRWVPVADLIPGSLADPTPFRFADRWWMLACGTPYGHNSLRLYHSDDLFHGWMESPISPLIEGNKGIARPAGRVIIHENRVIRYAQDCISRYGSRVRAFVFDDFPGIGTEAEIPGPILRPEGLWSADGMHHIDPHLLPDGQYIACVDGKSA